MDIVNFKREQQYHQQHIERVRGIKHVINTATPSSLGLKHLATRPKKQQLLDDRQQAIAQENRKLMERMTTILSGGKSKTNKPMTRSLNEKSRRQQVDKLNLENSLLVDRLKSVPSVLDVNKLEEDFQRHVKIGSQLRRRQMQPSPITQTPHSPPVKPRKNDGSTFDADLYMAQHTGSVALGRGNQVKHNNLVTSGENVLLGPYDESNLTGNGAPISTMQDFRREVISKKVLSQHQDFPQTTAKRKPQKSQEYEFSHDPQF
jgi:hypothetical protein